ncbi:DUF3662 domain-containing protein [Sulfidibacter corallicola]|uniref:DUF3662 domain-containing protein n=1 Tax=Sulfidibacter corallicola TaxID=2818388 RepID=A0A8A4TW65_SULCO|nr:FhaA domain-containing protein [Sulfidibacter corallicola]QTD53597.1 DUF3662 domain-containing protein [Sulfidibacter corallicola]
MTWKTNLKNAFKLESVNNYFAELFEVQLPLVLQAAGDLSLQGIDIVRACETTAEENRVVINSDTVYMHECFLIYTHPEDWRRLEPLLDEIRKDAAEHLTNLKTQKGYKTRNPFSIEFQKDPRVALGQTVVVSSTRKNIVRTVIESVALPPDSPLSFDAGSLKLEPAQRDALRDVFVTLDKGDRESALAEVQEINRRFPDFAIGQVLECLLWFLMGDSSAGLRYLNTHPLLAKHELGLYLKSLAYLDIADVPRAVSFHGKAFQANPNAMGYLVKGLIDLVRGKPEEASKELKLAATMEPDFKGLRETYMRQYAHLSRVEPEQVAHTMPSAPAFLRLISPFSRDSYNVVTQPGLEFMLLKGSRLGDQVLKASQNADKSHFRLVRDTRGLWIRFHSGFPGSVLVNGKPLANGEPHMLAEDDILLLGSVSIEYYRQSRKGGPRAHLGNRDHRLPCHVIRVVERGKTRETWLFPCDHAVTIGRGKDVGNDLVLTDRGISGEHGELHWEGAQFYFADKQSSNGTAKNGRKFSGSTKLLHGDVLQLASLSLEVRYGGVLSVPPKAMAG